MGTPNDIEVLNSIFNPLLPNGSLLFDENVPVEIPELEEMITLDVESAKTLELEGIAAAEQKDYARALELFSSSIETAPQRASGYNNRAQTLRLIGRVREAKEDLNNAIALSGGKGRAACQAYCQRGLLHLRDKDEAEAKVDFESAATLGSQFAKAQLVQMNPYAALCNKMLRGVFDKLQKGLPTDEKETDSSIKQ